MAPGHAQRRDGLVLVMLALNFGAVFLSRNAAGLTGPYLKHSLGLDNAQLGALSAGLGFTWAVVGFLGTALIERRLSAWTALTLLALVDAVSLFGTALAAGFWAVMALRMLAGAAGGPVLPLSQAQIALGSVPENRGRRMGVIQAFGGGLVGGILAPLCLIALANLWGWRAPFAAAAAISTIAAALMWWGGSALNAGPLGAPRGDADRAVPSAAHSQRNLALCCIVSVLMVGWLIITTTFLPTFLIGGLGWSSYRTAFAMSGFGITSMLGALAVPMVSDRIGRRPALVGCGLIGTLAAVGICLLHTDAVLSVAIVAGVGVAGGAFPIFMAAIPAESAASGRIAVGIALVQGVGELAGGVGGPLLAGLAGDRFGTRAMVWMAAGCLGAAAVVSCLLTETHPRRPH